MDNKNNLLLNDLKTLTNKNENYSNELLKNIIKMSNETLIKENILNDMGAISSAYGAIKPYDIIIEFNWDDFYA